MLVKSLMISDLDDGDRGDRPRKVVELFNADLYKLETDETADNIQKKDAREVVYGWNC